MTTPRYGTANRFSNPFRFMDISRFFQPNRSYTSSAPSMAAMFPFLNLTQGAIPTALAPDTKATESTSRAPSSESMPFGTSTMRSNGVKYKGTSSDTGGSMSGGHRTIPQPEIPNMPGMGEDIQAWYNEWLKRQKRGG
jgi:hypothetical protein